MSEAEGIRAENISRMVHGLVDARAQDGGWDVKTPLMYPSGATVTVSVADGGDGFRVSDFGLGFSEAYSMDISHGFSRAAKAMADDYGLIYERRRLIVPAVSWGSLGAAVKLVANCSQGAVILAAERANERKVEERSDRLYSRLRKLFPNTAKQAVVRGASNTEWTVDALVEVGDHSAAFDAVTSHANSVASTATKFRDLALLENPPALGAAVESKRAMGTLLAVLSQSASVIEDDASDQQFRQLARAA